MPRRSLTVAAVERIRAPADGQSDHFDKGYPGLALRVSYGGAKAWVYFFRLHGKLRRLTLGRFPAMGLAEARTAWQQARKVVGRGENPARQRPAEADSFAAVADNWLRRDQGKNRSAAEVRRIIERDVKPVWGDRPLAGIKRRDAIELIDAIADRGAITMARRTHAHLHRLFRWAVGRDIIESNPLADLPKPGQDVKRDRVLADAELAAVWHAATAIGWPFGSVVQLLMLTGARKDEIVALRWEEIDGDVIKLAGGRTKNGEPKIIPLSSPAAALIRSLPRVGDKFAFTTTGGAPVSGWSKAKTLIHAKATEINGRALAPWRFHDLRRTVATGLQRLGFQLQVIEEILGHVTGSRAGVVGIYQRHRFEDEKRAALDAWAQHIETLAAGRLKILPLRRA